MKRLFGILLWALFCLFGTQLSFGQNNREQVLALQRQAIELMDNGDPDQGIVLLRQALTLDPDYWPLTYEMAYAYMVKRDYQKAIKLAKTLYKYEDCNDLVYQLVGNCYDYLKNPKKALKVYAQGLKRFPDSGALYLEQGVVSGMQGHYDEAVASFEKGISVAPMFPSNYYRAAQFYAYSTSKVWSQIYSEIMMNLLPSGDRHNDRYASGRGCAGALRCRVRGGDAGCGRGRTVRRSGIPEPDPEPVDRRRPEEVGRRGEYGAEV